MSVRAKFKVESVEHTADSANVKLSAVISGSEENKQFFRWTPSGGIQLSTVNKEAANRFEPGKEYYVDFTPAP
ncbi:MAG: hypothetical protein KGL39_35505 [Patescibacteria group bacterium]|nr:hypothetical protein [Patescibacteria group bacterium]